MEEHQTKAPLLSQAPSFSDMPYTLCQQTKNDKRSFAVKAFCFQPASSVYKGNRSRTETYSSSPYTPPYYCSQQTRKLRFNCKPNGYQQKKPTTHVPGRSRMCYQNFSQVTCAGGCGRTTSESRSGAVVDCGRTGSRHRDYRIVRVCQTIRKEYTSSRRSSSQYCSSCYRSASPYSSSSGYSSRSSSRYY